MKVSNRFTTTDVEEYFSSYTRDFDRYYVNFHKYRYTILLNLIEAIHQVRDQKPMQILDVGPMFQTNIIRDSFAESAVNSLGYHWKRNKMEGKEYHIEANLNETDEVPVENYTKNDIINCAEVIEHLYTMPKKVIGFLTTLLNENGFLIIQTPNGVSLDRRVNMLIGKNPYDMINEKRMNHYREYTMSELTTILKDCGYKIHHSSITNYFNPNKTLGQKLFRKLSPIIPRNLRQGMTIVASRR